MRLGTERDLVTASGPRAAAAGPGLDRTRAAAGPGGGPRPRRDTGPYYRRDPTTSSIAQRGARTQYDGRTLLPASGLKAAVSHARPGPGPAATVRYGKAARYCR